MNNPWYILAGLALVNLFSFAVTGYDKWQAVRGGWRIPEKTLLGLAAVGGGPGVYLAMRTFRHKTRHPRFTIGVPAIMAAQVIAVCYFFRN